MRGRILTIAVIALLIVAAALFVGFRLLGRSGPRDLSALIDQARAQATPRQANTTEPTATPDAPAIEGLIAQGVYAVRLSTARTLSQRTDIPVARRVELLVGALRAEVAGPSADAPPVKDSYLTPDGVMRLAIVRTMSELGTDAMPALKDATHGASGTMREHLLVALAYLGDRDVLPEVRALVTDASDPVVRMDAARALGVAEDAGAVEALGKALSDSFRVEATDSLGQYQIYPVREQAVGALDHLGVATVRHGDGTFTLGEE